MDVAALDQAREALTKSQRKIFDFVWDNPGCDKDDIIYSLWPDFPKGGPVNAINAVSAQICLANKRMEGVSVRANQRGAGAVYFVTVD